ncbi:hypothetical protein ABB37_01598 [Leptomonas pyrrhocoris]|uniref:Uncharacterized protein n=1 Tax=Leptomonas pyrrhocoris TaxID=157538 RepID=A0A0N0DZG0_LEPPY|nr:hypothetical protein ABB37_01598 [Leptomonas pyrrhocoris]KPA85251.1 hypothetical protein ABB37_01598 [Leptomonas pyrrhocoris]|eukprot:XP_015663690.1 hypothetical protein ABB37_01598 [Leptomonas pyrrhocoris]
MSSRMKGDKELPGSFEMAQVDAPSAAVSAASATAAKPTPAYSSLPASPFFARREGLSAGGTKVEGGSEQTDALRIRVWYLDDVLSRAEPKFVPDVATLKQMLPERDLAGPLAGSPTVAGDHFAEVPYGPAAAAAAAREGGPQLSGAGSKPRLDALGSLNDRQSFPSISLSPASPTHPGGHPAWVSVRAASQSELTEILNWLPIHVLTRRRILNILWEHGPQAGDPSGVEGLVAGEQAGKSANKSKTNSKLSRRGVGSDTNNAAAQHSNAGNADDDDNDAGEYEGEEDEHPHPHHSIAHHNFLEYFPAHGYAVLCLQAVPLPEEESAESDATPREDLIAHETQVPSTPVIALAFESTLFTFSVCRFGGEGDVRLIVANRVGSPSAHGARGGMPARVTSINTLSSTLTLTENDRSQRDAAQRTGEDVMNDSSTAAFFKSTVGPVDQSSDVHDGNAHSTTPFSPAAVAREERRTRSPPHPLSYSRLALAGPTQAHPSSPSHNTGTPSATSMKNWNAATAISVVCSSLISAIISYLQQSTRSLLMEANQLDELVLQILPSRVDQDDVLVRTKRIRNLIAAFHIDALQKERVLKQLLLPAVRQTPLAQSLQAIERYQRSLSSVRSTVIKLRKGRDIVNLSNMTLISGVSARLLSHCNFMDYLNHVQTQIAVVVMPVAVIPGIFASNVKVPWSDSDSMTPFYCLTVLSFGVMAIGVAYPLYTFFMYRMPKALAPLE